jgi:hypothetical protein
MPIEKDNLDKKNEVIQNKIGSLDSQKISDEKMVVDQIAEK